jgi:hypothetical protein
MINIDMDSDFANEKISSIIGIALLLIIFNFTKKSFVIINKIVVKKS